MNNAASALALLRWKGKSKAYRQSIMRELRAERQKRLCKSERIAIARIAARARWAQVRASQATNNEGEE